MTQHTFLLRVTADASGTVTEVETRDRSGAWHPALGFFSTAGLLSNASEFILERINEDMRRDIESAGDDS